MSRTRTAAALHVLNALNEDAARQHARIAKLSGEIVEAPLNRIMILTADLQRATAALNALKDVEFDVEELDDQVTVTGKLTVEAALMRAMHQVAQRQGDAAMNLAKESKEAVEGKVGALRSAAFHIGDAFHDHLREQAKASV